VVRTGKKAQVSGGSGDWVCTWADGRPIAHESAKSRIIVGTAAEVRAFLVRTECELTDYGKDPPALSVLTYVRKFIGAHRIEELYIGSANDAYQGHYRRCPMSDERGSQRFPTDNAKPTTDCTESCWRKKAEAGDLEAQFNLAKIYYGGNATEKKWPQLGSRPLHKEDMPGRNHFLHGCT
jgi:hypothetical protein